MIRKVFSIFRFLFVISRLTSFKSWKSSKVQYKVYHRNSGGNYTVRVGENGAYEYMSATEIRQGILEDAE